MSQELVPNPTTDLAEGRYAKRAKMLLKLGSDTFNVGFQLDGNSLVADEAVVQGIMDMADRRVGSIARSENAPKLADGEYLALDDDRFGAVSDWASQWAAAMGWLLRGVTGNEQQGPEGQKTFQAKQAEDGIRAEFREAENDGAGPSGFQMVPIANGACAADENAGCD